MPGNVGNAAPPARVKAVIERGGRYLLALHNNRVPENKGKWTFLGGLIEPDDASPEAALLRELQEELQVQGQVLGAVGTFLYRDQRCLVPAADFAGEPVPNPEEIIALRWFTRDGIDGLARADLLHMGFEREAVDCAVSLRRGQSAVTSAHHR